MTTAPARLADRPATRGSVIGYCRISDARGSDDGTDRQAVDIRRLAKQHGLPAPTIVVEHGSASTYARKPRAEFLRLLDQMRSGQVTDLLIWHSDRYLRQPRELEMLIDVVKQTGVRVHSVMGGRVDLETADGMLRARIQTDVAAYESDHRSDRVKAASQQRAERGRPNGGGHRPYAFEPDGVTIRPAEAAIVREMTARVLGGETIRSLATDLRNRGVPTADGARQWSAHNLKAVVIRPRNAALRTHRGELHDAVWPPLVARADWEAARAILTDPARSTGGPGNNVSTLLSGIAHCDAGHSIVSGGARQGRRIYVCAIGDKRGHRTRAADPTDELVIAVLCGTATQPGLLAHHGEGHPRAAGDDTDLHAQAQALRAGLARLEDGYADGAISLAGLKRNRARLDADLADVERRIATVAVPAPTADLESCTPATFRALPLDRQRAVVAALLDITILPARRTGPAFDYESVRIRPRPA